MFIIFVVALIVSVTFIIYFIYNPLVVNEVDVIRSNINLGKQKHKELITDLQCGLITESVISQVDVEIDKTLVQEINLAKKDKDINYKVSLLSLGFIILFVPIVSLGVYKFLVPQYDIFSMTKSSFSQLSTLEQGVINLKKYVEDNPNNFTAWQILGSVLFELNSTTEALNAYEKSYNINPDNVKLLVEYAAASLALSAKDSDFANKAQVLIDRALVVDPNDPGALYVAGLIAMHSKDVGLAKSLWQRALLLLPEDHPDRLVLQNILADEY